MEAENSGKFDPTPYVERLSLEKKLAFTNLSREVDNMAQEQAIECLKWFIAYHMAQEQTYKSMLTNCLKSDLGIPPEIPKL